MIVSKFLEFMLGILLMMTPMHYYRYAKKKRLKLLIISAAMAVSMLFILAPYIAYWEFLVPIIFVTGVCLYKIQNVELHLFFGLREIENLISLEDKSNTEIFSYAAICRHKKNLKHGSFNFYSWF